MGYEGSHFQDLYKITLDQAKRYPLGIPTSTIGALMPRTDGSDVFIEGHRFSGNVNVGSIEASLTAVPVPHVKAYIPTQELLRESSIVFKQKSRLPEEMASVKFLAPHFLIWWRDKLKTKSNVLDLYQATDKKRSNTGEAIELQAMKALKLLNNYDGVPVLYGTWGYATNHEMDITGLSRGVPTLPQGHCHISKVSEKHQDITYDTEIEERLRLHHYGPWNRLINSRFGIPIAQALKKNVLNSRFLKKSVSDVVYKHSYRQHENNRNSDSQGYEILFSSPIPIQTAFNGVVDIAGKFEDYYQQVLVCFSDFHKFTGDITKQEQIKAKLISLNEQFGFGDDSERWASFIFKIKPTLGQLQIWRREIDQNPQSTSSQRFVIKLNNLLRKVERFKSLPPDKLPLAKTLVQDTYSMPDVSRDHTWPAHFSAYYMFEDLSDIDRRVLTQKVIVMPSILNKTGIPERLLGVRLSRNIR